MFLPSSVTEAKRVMAKGFAIAESKMRELIVQNQELQKNLFEASQYIATLENTLLSTNKSSPNFYGFDMEKPPPDVF